MVKEKELIGVFRLGDQRDQAVKFESSGPKLITNASFGARHRRWDRGEPSFDQILNDGWFSLVQTIANRSGKLRQIWGGGGQRILQTEIEAVDADRGGVKIVGLARIEHILCCAPRIGE